MKQDLPKTDYQIKFRQLFEKGLEMIRTDKIPRHLLVEILDEYVKNLDRLPQIDQKLDAVEKGINPRENLKNLILIGAQAVLFQEKENVERELIETNINYDKILGLITHEFKNLLTTIQGYHRILQRHFQDVDQPDVIDTLESSERITKKLFQLVDSILKMSLGEKKILRPSYKLIDFVADVIKPFERDLRSALEVKNMTLQLQIKAKKTMLSGDEDLLEIAVRNLLENAVKYGDADSKIVLTLKNKVTNLEVTIRNKSSGVSGDICEGIFGKFHTRPVGDISGGTGIGLYNVRNIIMLHDGQITCALKPGKWIEFKFSLPMELDEQNDR